MATKTYTFTEDEARALAILVNNAEHDADQERLKSRIDSPQERAFEADQRFFQGIQAKLAARDSVPSGR